MDIKIKIFSYTYGEETTNHNKNGKLQKLVFVSYDKVKELVIDNLYDILRLELEQELKLNPDENPIYAEYNKVIKRATRVESHIAILKSAKVLDYEFSSSSTDAKIISNHKYTITAENVKIKKKPFEIDTLYMSK
ncbi:MAG TPA: hypothetical protein VFV86_09535 [Nitrososphaeraceae archaeon]|nr:hypothetical protein [Nitrososphaeraceae archaeon]